MTKKTEQKDAKAAPKSKKTEKKETKTAVKKEVKETETVKAAKAVDVSDAGAELLEGETEAIVKAEAAEEEKEALGKGKLNKYYEAVGRRKTAIARVRLFTRGDKAFIVNELPFEKHFPSPEFKSIIEAPLIKMNCADRFRISVLVKGGGVNAQAEAIRHGIARALVLFNADFKKRLKKSGYLTRDPRMKERKKPGLRRARRAPQWAKR